MSQRQPPRLGTLILERLGSQNDALIGDLAEEYRGGRSAPWYWWQVLTSVVIGAGRELWSDKWLGVQVVATYIGIQTLLSYEWRMFWYQTTLSAQVQAFTESVWGPPDPLVNAPYQWILTVALVPLPILTGRVLAKLHPRQRGAVLGVSCLLVTVMTFPRLMQLSMSAQIAPERAMTLYLHVAMMVVLNAGLLVGICVAPKQPVASRVVE